MEHTTLTPPPPLLLLLLLLLLWLLLWLLLLVVVAITAVLAEGGEFEGEVYTLVPSTCVAEQKKHRGILVYIRSVL